MCRVRDLCQTFSICHPGEKLASVWADLTLDIKEIGWLPIPRFPCSFFFFFFKSKLARNRKFIRCLCDSKQHTCLVMWSRNGKNMLLPDKQVFLSLHAMNNQTCIIKPAMSTAEEGFRRSPLMKSMKESEGKRLYSITLQGSNVSNTGGSFFFGDLSYFTAKMWIMTFPVVFSKHVLISVSCYSIQFSFIYLAPNQNNYHPKGALHCKVQTLLLHRILCKTMNTCMFTTTES